MVEALYIHLPFCAALCSYCDFVSEVHVPERVRPYLNALENELRVRTEQIAPGGGYAPRTVFIGGGTPTALGLRELTTFFEILRRHVDLRAVQEFTIEANPGTTDAAKLELLLSQSVNRISFGTQSFQPHLLKLLGRIHDAEKARQAVRSARAAGFTNVSIDLLHGVPLQSLEDLRRDLAEVIALQTEHVSAYGLIYEPGTPLNTLVERGELAPLSPDEERAHYLRVMETLESAGLEQYEISNYARPGRESAHNLAYWRDASYLGVGVSAASFIDWRRSTNYHDMNAYLTAALASGEAIESSEVLEPDARAREALMLAFRMRAGVDAAEFRERWGLDIERDCPPILTYLREGLLERTPNGRYRISRLGLPVADGILAELI